MKGGQKAELVVNPDGSQSNQWEQISWEFLKALFLREYSETQAKEIFKKSQSDGETGLTFFYKIIQLHARSKLNLDEKQLVTLTVAHMNPLYNSKFQDKV